MNRIPLFKNECDQRDVDHISEVIKRGMYWTNGPEIEEFENKISEFVGIDYCVCFNSGTSALHAVLEANEVKGNEVIVPSFTFIATANSVIMAGGKPVFSDIEEKTYGLDVNDVNERITSKTKAIMPIHYAGCPCDIKSLVELAKDNGLLLFEDAAESLGAKYRDQMVGSFGDAAMFSFTPSKIISTGEGGVIVTDNEKLYRSLRLIRSHGRNDEVTMPNWMDNMNYIRLGYNFRMPSICAALGLAQMNKIDKLIKRRRKIASIYNKGLGNVKGINEPKELERFYHTYQMFPIIVKDGEGIRNELKKELNEKGIETKVNFKPIHITPYYLKILKEKSILPITEKISKKVLCLPIFPTLSDEEITYIVDSIKNFMNK